MTLDGCWFFTGAVTLGGASDDEQCYEKTLLPPSPPQLPLRRKERAHLLLNHVHHSLRLCRTLTLRRYARVANARR